MNHHLRTFQGFTEAVFASSLGLKGNQYALRCKVHKVDTPQKDFTLLSVLTINFVTANSQAQR